MPPMAELRGDLSFMPCADLFRYLGNRAFSGKVSVRRGEREKDLLIQEGKAVQAGSSDPREYVGQILISGGHLDEDAFERAYQTQLSTLEPLGKVLVSSGGVPEELVRQALEFKIRETGIDLCSWTEGVFQVNRGPVRPDAAGITVRPVALAMIADAADERRKAWETIRKRLPSGETRLVAVSRDEAPRAKGAAEAKILSLLSEPRSVDELGLFLHATEFQLYAKLHGLLGRGAIRLETSRGAAAAPPPLPPRKDSARSSTTSPARAVALAREALQADASSEAVAALRKAEAALLAALRAELLTKPVKPTLAEDLGELRDLPLTPPARYLLTRMDGSRELGAIVRVAPMRELDALELVKRLMGDGWIRL